MTNHRRFSSNFLFALPLGLPGLGLLGMCVFYLLLYTWIQPYEFFHQRHHASELTLSEGLLGICAVLGVIGAALVRVSLKEMYREVLVTPDEIVFRQFRTFRVSFSEIQGITSTAGAVLITTPHGTVTVNATLKDFEVFKKLVRERFEARVLHAVQEKPVGIDRGGNRGQGCS